MLSVFLIAAALFPTAPERIEGKGLALTYDANGPVSILDAATGETLLDWSGDAAPWHVTLPGAHEALPPGTPARVEVSADRMSVSFVYETPGSPAAGTLRVSMHGDGVTPHVELALEITNRGDREFDLVEFPANMTEQGGAGTYLVYPYNSGVLVPLDERFADIRIYGSLPFVNGYPSNVMSMQFMGVQRGEASYMVMSTDRFGGLKRMGAVPQDSGVGLVCASHIGLMPGETVSLPPVRVVKTGAGGYEAMAAEYRRWVQEKTAPGGVPAVEMVNGVEKVPLQFVSLDAKRATRPGIELFRTTHGYPEHVVRPTLDGERFACLPYGKAAGCMRVFEETYGSKVVPQLWSFLRAEEDGGWPLLPVDPVATEDATAGNHTFPGLSYAGFLSALAGQKDHAVLYTNPTFMRQDSPDYDPALLFDTTGEGRIMMGGLAAMASEDSAYVSPSQVEAYQREQLGRVFQEANEGQPGAGAVMFDSSQALGGTLFNNSILRRDPGLDIDRNPNARYAERYGYTGRDSYVQDRIRRDLALCAAASSQGFAGEWVSELTAMYLDMNAGSICLHREYPDSVLREHNAIPVPLFQMVYGDCEYFVIRVGAASDANLGSGSDLIGAETSRRATGMFGAVHQVLHWGGVPWAGDVAGKLMGRTYLVTRDNLARESLLGLRAGHRMLDTAGADRVDFRAVRETRWLDNQGRVVAWHWDNNTGAVATLPEIEGTFLSPLWGTDEPVAGSLERLFAGSTITLMASGTFSAWDFTGSLKWHGPGGEVTVTIEDTAATPEGLTVIWDGDRLSIGNGVSQARSVNVTLTGLDTKGLSKLDLQFQGQADTVVEVTDSGSGSVIISAALPPAPAPIRMGSPASVVTLGRQ